MLSPQLPQRIDNRAPTDDASLWAASRSSLLGDRRAEVKGDILTVVIEIDDRAEMSNTSQRARSGSQSMGMPQLFGIPQRIDQSLPEGASIGTAVEADSSSSSTGNGSVRRNEKVTLRVAATVTGVLPNGVLEIAGTQEVRVNFELRELNITGYVRPEDVSRQNEVTYDKIASARISYGGRGRITEMQQPRYGQQIADIVLPF
jgi:flagellar L-ring protein precursor FlgH